MEDNTNSDAKKDVTFHSDDLSNTKAKEKREVFNVQQKKTIKQSAEEFQRKFTAAKNRAANPGPDTNGVIKSKKLISKKPFIICFIILALGIGGYFAYPVVRNYFELTPEKANMELEKNPEKFISMYNKLISQTDDPKEKASLLIDRAFLLTEQYEKEYFSKALEDAYQADSLYPSMTTAALIAELEQKFGSEEKAKEWEEKILERDGIEIIKGEG